MWCADLKGTPPTLVELGADATTHLYKYPGKQGCPLMVQQWPFMILCAKLGSRSPKGKGALCLQNMMRQSSGLALSVTPFPPPAPFSGGI